MISRYGAMALWSYGAMELRCKLLIRLNLIKLIYINFYQTFAGGIWVLYYLLLHERQTNIYLFQMTRYHPCGIHYWDKTFSLNACATDQFYFTTLVWTREIFPVKQIAHVAIAKTYICMKARDVKKENQMKSKLFRGNLSTRKGEVSFFHTSVNINIKYSSVAVTKFVCKEIWLKNHFTLKKKRKCYKYLQ